MNKHEEFKIEEIFNSLIGEIGWFGESNNDTKSEKNLEVFEELFEHMALKIANEYETSKNSPLYSVNKLHRLYGDILLGIYHVVGEALERGRNDEI